MHIAESIAQLRTLRELWKDKNQSVALVPTMGALHGGHVALLEKARSVADRVVVSIFVNPTQFAPGEDLERYPRPLEEDIRLLERCGVDLAFIPAAHEMYGAGFKTFVTVDGLSSKLCGLSRPTHFRGVATIVLKLLNVVGPNVAIFGQKDAQQTIVIKRMVADLGVSVEIVICPTVRDFDGLALSSRNRYLNDAERKAARVIPQSLELARQLFARGERQSRVLLDQVFTHMSSEPLVRLDYAEVVDLDELNSVDVIYGSALLALAAVVGKTRLIDNVVLTSDSTEKMIA